MATIGAGNPNYIHVKCDQTVIHTYAYIHDVIKAEVKFMLKILCIILLRISHNSCIIDLVTL